MINALIKPKSTQLEMKWGKSEMKWGKSETEFQMHLTNHKTKKMLKKRRNHFLERTEIDDLLKDMVILIHSTQRKKKKTVAEPKTYEEAAKSRKAKFWKQAMQAEVESLENNNTWTLVDRPKDKNVLPGKMGIQS